jgi:alpha-tubulin suppressor-like RCC1 family protein
VQVTGVWGATSLAVGTYHSCARLSSGTVSCWGYNNNGQLGDGTAVSRVYPTQVPNLYGVVDVFAASNQTCARLDTGAIRCWGNNNNGQLGNDTNSYAYAPSQVVF